MIDVYMPGIYPFDDYDEPDNKIGGNFIEAPLKGKENGDAYRKHLKENGLDKVDNDFVPNFIFISLGTDTSQVDQQGPYLNLDKSRATSLKPKDYGKIVEDIHNKYPNARIVVVSEGGYSHPVFSEGFCGVAEAMRKFNRPVLVSKDHNVNNIRSISNNCANYSNSSSNNIKNSLKSLSTKKDKFIDNGKRDRNEFSGNGGKSYLNGMSDGEYFDNGSDNYFQPKKKKRKLNNNEQTEQDKNQNNICNNPYSSYNKNKHKRRHKKKSYDHNQFNQRKRHSNCIFTAKLSSLNYSPS
ncbi:MAG: hypothetical protein GY821_10155 [Gammaproteobacteria bacterium]|nr:hypothetical protein [Gammaproteobacteria bacterium]